MPNFKKGTIINDRFLLIECLGMGIFSQVWRAIDETLDTEVALKVFSPLTPEGMKELKREYSNTIGVLHQNLLTPQGMDVCSDGAYLVMKCCSKGSASTLAGMADEVMVWHFIHDVAAGLAYLHGLDEPLIHQDMKLANIMIDDDDRFLISDFGICYKVTQVMVRQTGHGRAAAMAYMSPERFSADYDLPLTSSDIWTLGALIYELCTGSAPFGDFGGAAQRNGQPVPQLSKVWSKELQMLYNACMQLNTWDRPKASKIRDFASLMLKNQRPDPSMLGIARQPAAPVSDYTKNTPDSLFGGMAPVSDTSLSHPSVDTGERSAAADSSLPAYMSMDNGNVPSASASATGSQAPEGFERVSQMDDAAHFTSGDRYRGRAERRTTRHVHKHRTPLRKAYDWLKSKSSYISFILIVALCVGVYWYGLDNLLSLKFLPEKKIDSDGLVETAQAVDDVEAVTTVLDDTDSLAAQVDPANTKFVHNLPAPPPPRTQKGISPVGRTNAATKHQPEAQNVSNQTTNPPAAPAPAPSATPPANNKPQNNTADNSTKKPETKSGTKKTSAPQTGELGTAIQNGDYAAIKRLADGGSAAAAGVMAKKYLHDHNHAAADEYAKMAKKGGDPAGDEVINKLKVQGYYQ